LPRVAKKRTRCWQKCCSHKREKKTVAKVAGDRKKKKRKGGRKLEERNLWPARDPSFRKWEKRVSGPGKDFPSGGDKVFLRQKGGTVPPGKLPLGNKPPKGPHECRQEAPGGLGKIVVAARGRTLGGGVLRPWGKNNPGGIRRNPKRIWHRRLKGKRGIGPNQGKGTRSPSKKTPLSEKKTQKRPISEKESPGWKSKPP